MTASRSPGVVYSNNTGRPIFVSVMFDGVTYGWPCRLYVGAEYSYGYFASGNAWPAGCFGIIPAGVSYSADTSGGGGYLIRWFELR